MWSELGHLLTRPWRSATARGLKWIVLNEDLGRGAVFLVNPSNHRQRHSALSTEDFAPAWTTLEGSREIRGGQTQLLQAKLERFDRIWGNVLTES
jgi:hypothetical protein